MASIILAGGKSIRLGRDKALEVVAGQYLIEQVIERLSTLGDEIIVVVSHGSSLPDLRVREAVDVYPDKGPLGGIYTGLKASSSSHSLVVACDMPLLNMDLVRYLLAQSRGFDAVVPHASGNPEPLHAVYSRSCLGSIEAALAENRLQVSGLFDEMKVRYVEEAEIDEFDPEHLSFFNVNSQSDLERARRILERRKYASSV